MDVKTLNSELGKRLNRDPEDINLLCEQLGAVIAESLANGDSVAIPSFGSFEPKKRMERVAVHPSTGKRILIPPKLSIMFRPSAMLKLKVRNS
ncbi:MAG: HU family DNA-binding protein [Bacteroidales bacterium]|nr:HU family DNA-binding protein [Bacteroidales bacterium]